MAARQTITFPLAENLLRTRVPIQPNRVQDLLIGIPLAANFISLHDFVASMNPAVSLATSDRVKSPEIYLKPDKTRHWLMDFQTAPLDHAFTGWIYLPESSVPQLGNAPTLQSIFYLITAFGADTYFVEPMPDSINPMIETPNSAEMVDLKSQFSMIEATRRQTQFQRMMSDPRNFTQN